jgi:ribosomal protein L9
VLAKPLKALGEHRVGVRVYREVTADLRVVVARS